MNFFSVFIPFLYMEKKDLSFNCLLTAWTLAGVVDHRCRKSQLFFWSQFDPKLIHIQFRGYYLNKSWHGTQSSLETSPSIPPFPALLISKTSSLCLWSNSQRRIEFICISLIWPNARTLIRASDNHQGTVCADGKSEENAHGCQIYEIAKFIFL